jgi:hypothetical protein
MKQFPLNILLSLSLRYATSPEVVGSNPDNIIVLFSLPNPSILTMTMGLTQPIKIEYQEYS